MADDLVTGIRVEAEAGESNFKKPMREATEAMDDATEAAKRLEDATGEADTALATMAEGSAASTKIFNDNVEAAAWQAIADFLNVIDVILEVNAAIVANVNETAEMGDAIAKGAQEIEFSTDAYQRWDFILKRNNSSIDKAKGAIQTLTKASSDASKKQVEAFGKLGLSMEDVQALKPEELFSTVVEGLQSIEDVGDRASIASALFGSGGYKQLALLLGSTAEETADLAGLADKLGSIMSEENIANATKLMDATENLNTALDNIKRAFGEGLTDEFAELRSGLTELLTSVDWESLARAFETVYTPALNFLNDFLIPLAKVNLVGITGLLSGLQEVLSVIGRIVSGEMTLTEGVEELWTYGRPDDDPYMRLAEESEEAKNAISALAQAHNDFRDAFSDDLGGIAAELNEGALSDYDAAAQRFLQTLTQMAGDSENAAAANKWLAEQVEALTQATKDSELENPDARHTNDQYQEYLQSLIDIYQQYQQLLQQPPPEQDPAAQLAAAAETSTEAAETVKGNAETMLAELPATTGEIVNSFAQGSSEMSQAAASAVEETNSTMAANMATLASNAYVWGGDMMLSLARGILDGAGSYVGPAIESVAGDIASMIGFSEPDVGPLSNFHTFAPDMMALFAQGIRDGAGLIRGAIGESFDLGPLIGAQAAGRTFNAGGVSVVIYASEGQSADELYDVFSMRLQHEVAAQEAVFST
ncbi:MAG: hypothetical protein IKO83_01610 [Oscillospiraceae bacterium]|nr:hypothetical protein [Oscillospiraceae bacterium]MBR4548599.1 hypothetical protein [Oscillospiraceae bacterium]